MAISEKRRITFTAIAVILVGIITGFLLGSVIMSGAPPTKTFNIVNYHWGFALFDEDWNEIEKIEVDRGTTVRLVAIPLSLLSSEIKEQLWQRVIDKGFGEYQGGDPEIAGLIEEANADSDSLNHGVFIGELNVDLRSDGNASTLEEGIDSVEFTTDAMGSFDMICSVFCGAGHVDMIAEGAFVVK